jgi:cytosolic carboxypeptidase protein 2/3
MDNSETAAREGEELPGVAALKILGQTNHSALYGGKTAKMMKVNNVNNKSMLDALLNAVGVSDEVIHKQQQPQQNIDNKNNADNVSTSDNNNKEDYGTPIFPPSSNNMLGFQGPSNDSNTDFKELNLNSEYVIINNTDKVNNDDEGSDAGSDWEEDTVSASNLTDTKPPLHPTIERGVVSDKNSNSNIISDDEDGLITIGLTPRQTSEKNVSKCNEEKSSEKKSSEDVIEKNEDNKLDNLLTALKQLPGIASPDEARNWGPVPWGRFPSDKKNSATSWSFPLLQNPISESEPIRTNLLNPAAVSSREAIRRRAIIFSPLSADPRNNKKEERMRRYPRVAYDWREAQEATSGVTSCQQDSPNVKKGNFSSLTFDSRFECGNLLRAVQIGPYEYDLFVRADVNTKSYMQWWYFAVQNTHPSNWRDLALEKANKRKEQAWGGANSSGINVGSVRRNSREPTSLGVNPSGSVTIKFNIVNLCKPDSMYNKGMQPILYSCFEAENAGIGWRRAGSDICYFGNQYTRIDSKGNHYTLTFKITFQNPNDTVLLAHSPPYTYTDNLRHLKELTKNRGTCIRRSILCKTLAERQCDLLTITDFEEPEDPKKRRRAIVITARVHPGETPASWIMKGFLDFVTGTSAAAKLLRKMFIFKVVPMLNPDGVFYGNNRCNLSGVDLNRQWSYPSPLRHPTVYHTKNMIRELRTIRPVVLYLDIHAHSRKNNIFMYGVEEKNRPTPSRRIIPLLMSKGLFSHKFFSYRDCHFKVTPGRESTARVVVARELHVANSYTVESTYCGSNQGPLAGKQFNVQHWELFGMGMADTMLQLYHTDSEKRIHVQKCLALLQGSLYHRSSGSSNTRRQQREEEAAEKALAIIHANNPGDNGENVESLIVDKNASDFNYKNLNDMGDKLGLGLGQVTATTPQRRTSDSFLYTNFQEQKFIQAAAFQDFEIYQEVFSPNIPKEEAKKESRRSRKNTKKLHTNGRHSTIRNTTSKTRSQIHGKKKQNNSSTNISNRAVSNADGGSSSEKLVVDDVSSSDGLEDDNNNSNKSKNGQLSPTAKAAGVSGSKKKVFGNSGKILYPSERQRFDNKKSSSTNKGSITHNNDKSKVIYPSSQKQDKELTVKKRDIHMQVSGETSMNFVVPPYKPLKLKRSSNFGNILHNLRASARRTSSAPNNNNGVEGGNVLLLASDSELSNQSYNEGNVNNNKSKDKSLIPLRMPQIGFVQEKVPANMLIIDQNNTNGIDSNNVGNTGVKDPDEVKVARQPAIKRSIKRSRRSKRRNNKKRSVVNHSNSSSFRNNNSSSRNNPNIRTTAQDIKRMLKQKLHGRHKNRKKNTKSKGPVNNSRPSQPQNNVHYRPMRQQRSNGAGDDAIFLPSVGHAVSHIHTRKNINANGHGELTPLSPTRNSQNKVRNAFVLDSKGTRGRIYRNFNDLPNFSPVRSRPAFT